MASLLVVSITSLLRAQGVLQTDLGSAQQVVKTRKYLMQTVKLNSADAAKKFEAGQLADIPANGAALALSAKVMPPLYREKHEAAYDGKGKFFKGAAPADFEAACEAMRVAAQNVRMNAEKGDKAGVAQAMGQLEQSCGACHNTYRGSF
jgi:cytochrome c556